MLQEKSHISQNKSLEIRCISALRLAKQRMQLEIDNRCELSASVDRMERVLFSAEKVHSALLLECFVDLMVALKKMEKQTSRTDTSLRPIGLQVATANNIAPIHLEWNYHSPNSLFVIEYANFEETNKPDWRIYSKTRSTSFTVRGLPKGKAYWFRISALPTAV